MNCGLTEPTKLAKTQAQCEHSPSLNSLQYAIYIDGGQGPESLVCNLLMVALDTSNVHADIKIAQTDQS